MGGIPEEPCIDTETGEILYHPPLYNAETGEYEGSPYHPHRIKFRIPPPPGEDIAKKPRKCCKRRLELITAAVFFIPTIILFYPILSLFVFTLEMILHNWAHRKNKALTDSRFYYRSPLHFIVKEFCGRCREIEAKEKITQIQDMRNNDKMKSYSLEYIRKIVN